MEKRYKIVFVLLIITVFLNSCKLCTSCKNELKDKLDGYFPYKNGDSVTFICSDLETKYSVKITYLSPDGDSECPGSEGTLNCSGEISMNIGDYYAKLMQGPNMHANALTASESLNKFYDSSYYPEYKLVDTVNFKINSKEFEAKHYITIDTIRLTNYNDTIRLTDTSFYSEFWTSMDRKLLGYILVENHIPHKWVLK